MPHRRKEKDLLAHPNGQDLGRRWIVLAGCDYCGSAMNADDLWLHLSACTALCTQSDGKGCVDYKL